MELRESAPCRALGIFMLSFSAFVLVYVLQSPSWQLSFVLNPQSLHQFYLGLSVAPILCVFSFFVLGSIGLIVWPQPSRDFYLSLPSPIGVLMSLVPFELLLAFQILVASPLETLIAGSVVGSAIALANYFVFTKGTSLVTLETAPNDGVHDVGGETRKQKSYLINIAAYVTLVTVIFLVLPNSDVWIAAKTVAAITVVVEALTVTAFGN